MEAPKSSRAGERRGDSEGSRAEKSSGVQRTGEACSPNMWGAVRRVKSVLERWSVSGSGVWPRGVSSALSWLAASLIYSGASSLRRFQRCPSCVTIGKADEI